MYCIISNRISLLLSDKIFFITGYRSVTFFILLFMLNIPLSAQDSVDWFNEPLDFELDNACLIDPTGSRAQATTSLFDLNDFDLPTLKTSWGEFVTGSIEAEMAEAIKPVTASGTNSVSMIVVDDFTNYIGSPNNLTLAIPTPITPTHGDYVLSVANSSLNSISGTGITDISIKRVDYGTDPTLASVNSLLDLALSDEKDSASVVLNLSWVLLGCDGGALFDPNEEILGDEHLIRFKILNYFAQRMSVSYDSNDVEENQVLSFAEYIIAANSLEGINIEESEIQKLIASYILVSHIASNEELRESLSDVLHPVDDTHPLDQIEAIKSKLDDLDIFPEEFNLVVAQSLWINRHYYFSQNRQTEFDNLRGLLDGKLLNDTEISLRVWPVGAAGNDSLVGASLRAHAPASWENVIAVSGYTAENSTSLWDYSQLGRFKGPAALHKIPNEPTWVAGTSFASPMISVALSFGESRGSCNKELLKKIPKYDNISFWYLASELSC